MKRKLIPAGHRLLVKLLKTDESQEVRSKEGIILEIKDRKSIEREQFATQEARVISLGMNAFKAFDSGEPWCREGDLVLITKYSGEDRTDIEDDAIYRVINDEDVLAIFDNE